MYANGENRPGCYYIGEPGGEVGRGEDDAAEVENKCGKQIIGSRTWAELYDSSQPWADQDDTESFFDGICEKEFVWSESCVSHETVEVQESEFGEHWEREVVDLVERATALAKSWSDGKLSSAEADEMQAIAKRVLQMKEDVDAAKHASPIPGAWPGMD